MNGASAYPIDRTDDRVLPPDYAGPGLLFDIDGTYLATDLDRALALLRIPIEFPVDKRNVPGTAALLRELRHGPGGATRLTPLWFVSASPPLLRGVIQKKMLADGVEPDGITFKSWGTLLLRGRLGQLKAQIAFKLSALLAHRASHPELRQEWLFGDDREDDPLIYALYADIAGGRLRGEALGEVLGQLDVVGGDAAAVVSAAAALPSVDPVRRVYIHLVTGGSPERLGTFAPFVVATRNSAQAALALLEEGMVRPEAVVSVVRDLPSADELPLGETFADAIARGLVAPERAATAASALREAGLWSGAADPDEPLDSRVPTLPLPPARRTPPEALRWRRQA